MNTGGENLPPPLRTYNHGNYQHDLTFGQFGENFTVEGAIYESGGNRDVHIGDVFRIGTA